MSSANSDRAILSSPRVLSAPEQVSKAITEAILEGALKSGDRLPTEEDLAERFGVSRPTIREGLHRLIARQVLVSQRGRNGGYRVADFHLPDLAEGLGQFLTLSLGAQEVLPDQLYRFRHALEVLSAREAARNRTLDDLVELRQALPDSSAIATYDLAVADLHFHRILAQSTHNPLITSFVEAATVAFHSVCVDMSDSSPDLVVGQLPELLDAISDQDLDLAGQYMDRHLDYFASYARGHVRDPSSE